MLSQISISYWRGNVNLEVALGCNQTRVSFCVGEVGYNALQPRDPNLLAAANKKEPL